MKRLVLFIMILLIGYVSKPLWEEPVQQLVPSSRDSIRSAVDFLRENPEINFALDALNQQLNSFTESFDNVPTNSKDTNTEIPALTVPENQLFSIHNIELGDSRTDVEQVMGKPKRTSKNEYGVSWEAYHENYHNFMMVAYDENNIVRGLNTNQDLIASTTGIKRGTPKQLVQEHLGTPESIMRKGLINYQINSNGEYDVFLIDSSYVTIFYDKHKNHTVTAIQVIDEQLEQSKNAFYASPSQELKEGFEYQLFDLTNATRVNHNLPILTWDDHVRETARDHSLDMAENQYFSHTNLEGESPFDRMEEDSIRFMTAGENLAFGQFSSIFAHEGLMNSLGHRENILQESYEYLGVGVAFSNESQPYYTEMFYSDSPFK
ncbi:MAG TPA: CAP domain-containing protein [Bacillus sp. (in: firmicutes)]|uniref:CAP domain-containing protein n=1 Tax=Bacillus litorisediminis TaxID=2922713 RepID=UPI001FB03585|nr:CAP domain-containing protein [Bacillus litorisediminis]HWO74334.1 CAP domain-containing protein [Bacillus sp. (in: firmicutes)]